jgi:hypothetical protein
MIPLIIAGVAFVFVGTLLFGCVFCRMFANEYEHGEFEGGFKYVADQEHDKDGKDATGWRLELSRRAEQVFFPLCYPFNRLLGRTNADGTGKK